MAVVPPSKPVAQARSRVGGYARAIRAGELPADTQQLVDAKRDLRAELLADRVAKVVNDWPPLTKGQIDKVAAILRTGLQDNGAA